MFTNYKLKYKKYKTKYFLLKTQLSSSKNGLMKGGFTNVNNAILESKLTKDCLDNFIKNKTIKESNIFDTDIKQPLIIIVFASWCSHCHNLINDHYKSFIESKYKGNIKFLEENELNILGDYKIRGYPTILTLNGGDSNFKEFYQGRDIKSFEQFVFN